jgi:uncharacterized protein YecE (DUF72 family)
MTEIRIGTSGFHYDHWVGTYYPEGTKPAEMLELYRQTFDTVELNNTFYRLPKQSAVEGWEASVPKGFRFAVKGSRFITHMKKLKDPVPSVGRFFEALEPLRGSKMGPVVFQLPPRWKKNAERLEAFLAALPEGPDYAFELRDPSWIDDDVLALLTRHEAAFCIYQIAGNESPIHVTTDFAYVRLHGPTERAYEGSYGDAALDAWAERIDGWRGELRSVWVYFDNDQGAHAPHDALRLKARLA